MLKIKVKYLVFMLFIPLLTIYIYSCSGRFSQRLQGKWKASANIADSTDMHAWYLEYEFDGKNYKMKGYPPITEEGNYEIIQENGDSLYIYFNVLNSSPETKSHEDWMLVKDSTITKGELTLRKSVN